MVYWLCIILKDNEAAQSAVRKLVKVAAMLEEAPESNDTVVQYCGPNCG